MNASTDTPSPEPMEAPMAKQQPLGVRVERDTILVSDPALPAVPPTEISFERTLRIPDDGHDWPLPPGLGHFPLRTVASLGDRAPEEMRRRGGIVLPIYQAEALWISFDAPHWRPMAVKVGAGMVNAVNADPLDAELRDGREDYLVTPPQPWLDGFKTGEGTISQFVAMPLGRFVTVEGQLTGSETVGGLQLLVAGPRPGRFPTTPPEEVYYRREVGFALQCARLAEVPMAPMPAMGLGAGGRMTQKVYPDPHGAGTWVTERAARIWVHLVPAGLWPSLTGEPCPPTPADHDAYVRYGFPWFAVYDEPLGDVPVDPRWAGVKTVQALAGPDLAGPGSAIVDNASW